MGFDAEDDDVAALSAEDVLVREDGDEGVVGEFGGQQRRAARAVDAGGEGCGRDDDGVGWWGLSVGGPGNGGGESEVGGLAVGEGVEDALEDRGAEFAWVEGGRCWGGEFGGEVGVRVPQPRKVILMGIVSTDILVLQ